MFMPWLHMQPTDRADVQGGCDCWAQHRDFSKPAKAGEHEHKPEYEQEQRLIHVYPEGQEWLPRLESLLPDPPPAAWAQAGVQMPLL